MTKDAIAQGAVLAVGVTGDPRGDPYGNDPVPESVADRTAKHEIEHEKKNVVPEKEIDPNADDHTDNPPPSK